MLSVLKTIFISFGFEVRHELYDRMGLDQHAQPIMIEFNTHVNLEEKSAEVLGNLDWEKEQSYKTTRSIVIHGLINSNYKGACGGQFIIERDVIDGAFVEKNRYARLNSVSVYPHPIWRRKGLRSKMVNEFENLAKKFGASRIEGQIGSTDYAESPWLKDFYQKLGFTLTGKGTGFIIEKNLV